MTAGIAVSVVLPTYNELGNVAHLIDRVSRALRGVPHEILVMDDRSPDGTAGAAREASAQHPQVQVIERSPPAGLVVSIREGVRRARGRYVVWLDSDLSHPPELLPQLLAPLDRRVAEVTCASRYVPGGADARDARMARWASVMITRLAQWMIDDRVRDYTSGYIMASRQLVLEIGLYGDYGEYCIEFLGTSVHRGHRVVEIPYRNVSRQEGESKTATSVLGFVRRGWKYLLTIARLWWWRKIGSGP